MLRLFLLPEDKPASVLAPHRPPPLAGEARLAHPISVLSLASHAVGDRISEMYAGNHLASFAYDDLPIQIRVALPNANGEDVTNFLQSPGSRSLERGQLDTLFVLHLPPGRFYVEVEDWHSDAPLTATMPECDAQVRQTIREHIPVGAISERAAGFARWRQNSKVYPCPACRLFSS